MGYHWFTDIEASRQLAAALVARLHADPQFRDMIAAACAEYVEKMGGALPVASASAAPQASTRSYRLDGTPATFFLFLFLCFGLMGEFSVAFAFT